MDEFDHLRRSGRRIALPVVDLAFFELCAKRASLIPGELIRTHRILPLEEQHGVLRVATSEPLNVSALDDIRLATGFKIEPVLASRSQILRLIRKHFPEPDANR